jgi:CRP/FNR family cyclic AMP-dependent transcriptional regulator
VSTRGEPVAASWHDGRGSTVTRPGGAARLLEEDPDLGRRLPPDRFRAAKRVLVASVRTLELGWWNHRSDLVAREAVFGLLVLDGLLARYIVVGNKCSVELVGVGDLLELNQSESIAQANSHHDCRWRVLAPARLAVMDEECIRCAAAVPFVLGELAARALRRSDGLAVLLATAQVRELADRLHIILWHLAERWGRRTAAGVVLTLPLTQELLGGLACARRTSVSAALGTLERRRVLERRSRAELVLLERPPAVTSPEPNVVPTTLSATAASAA